MHIKSDILATASLAALAPEQRQPARATGFQDALQAAAAKTAVTPQTPAELASALRLRMLQQAIDLGDEGPETDSLSALSLLSALAPKNHAPASQNVDFSGFCNFTPVAAAPAAYVSPSPAAGPASLPDIIERAAARYQVAPEVVRAVIRAESGFDARAVSPAGAQGLMQLMPGTARDLGVTDPFDPEQNVMAGTRYLKQMLERYGGNLEKALAAYNWGPGNLDRSRDGRLPAETRHYIARIQGFLAKSG